MGIRRNVQQLFQRRCYSWICSCGCSKKTPTGSGQLKVCQPETQWEPLHIVLNTWKYFLKTAFSLWSYWVQGLFKARDWCILRLLLTGRNCSPGSLSLLQWVSHTTKAAPALCQPFWIIPSKSWPSCPDTTALYATPKGSSQAAESTGWAPQNRESQHLDHSSWAEKPQVITQVSQNCLGWKGP